MTQKTGSKGHGHPRFYELTREEEELHSAKNQDYDSGGDALGNFKRVAAILSLYPGLSVSSPIGVCLVYSLKQLDAVMWSLAQGYDLKTESRGQRLGDIGIYAKLARIMDEEQK